MTPEQEMVAQFHEMTGATINDWPTMPSQRDRDLRVALLEEELSELRGAKTLVEVADALADLLYVVYGAAETYGIDLEPVYREVHRSNMLKGALCNACGGSAGAIIAEGTIDICESCGGRGRVVVMREDGKILKGEDWRPPELAPIIQAQECRL